MIKTELLVPIRDNGGTAFRPSDWRELEQQFIKGFGAFSRETGVVGVWEFEGKVYRDRSRRYIVGLESWTQLSAWLDIARWACQRFRQEAVYIEVGGVPDILSRSG